MLESNPAQKGRRRGIETTQEERKVGKVNAHHPILGAVVRFDPETTTHHGGHIRNGPCNPSEQQNASIPSSKSRQEIIALAKEGLHDPNLLCDGLNDLRASPRTTK